MITDPIAQKIARFLWVDVWDNDPDERNCEVNVGDGQWDFCISEATALAGLFRKLQDESVSA